MYMYNIVLRAVATMKVKKTVLPTRHRFDVFSRDRMIYLGIYLEGLEHVVVRDSCAIAHIFACCVCCEHS